MSNLMVGVELLISGLIIVFLVLLFLMYVMKLMSVLFGKQPSEVRISKQPLATISADPGEEELVAVMAVIASLLPKNKQAIVRLKAVE
ncbi:MAG TPA: hypothetical protein DDZ91_03145 [Firmicutes bacterium]|jgi:sodium pump decarboxylase gamma subunit|nr:hypothetical protein [Bacillota bacterium]